MIFFIGKDITQGIQSQKKRHVPYMALHSLSLSFPSLKEWSCTFMALLFFIPSFYSLRISEWLKYAFMNRLNMFPFLLQSMNRSVQAQLSEWLSTMGVSDQFNNQDIQSGKTVCSLLRAIDRDSKIQLQEGNSAIARVNNWNLLTQALKALGIKLTQEDRSKIINGNHDVVFRVISRLKEIHQRNSKETEINIKDIDVKKEVGNADSLLQMFLLGLIRHFGLNAKEALSLLSNDSKYLAHILAKGLKGDFRPIDAFIAELLKNLGKIIAFSKNKENESFFLRSIKPGLISKSESVAQGSLQLLSSYLESIEAGPRMVLLKEHLIATLMLVIRRHPHLIDKVVGTTLEMASFSADFVNEMVDLTGKNELNNLLISLWRAFAKAKLQDRFIASPSFDKLVLHANNSLKDPQLALSSLTFFVELSSSHFSLFSSTSAQAVIGAFRDIPLSKQSQNLVFIHLCCTLIKSAGEQKHPLAPLIFKFLTSKLITSSGTEYETLAFNLAQVIADIPSIPTLPILQALSQRSELKLSQTQLNLYSQVLAFGAEPKSAVAIYNMASRTFVEDVGLGFELANILIQVISAFKEEEIIIDMTVKLVKVCLALYFANIKKLSQRRKPISYKTKLQGDEATSKLKTLEIQNFLRKVVSLKNSDINDSIEPLLCFSCMQIAALNKDQNKGFQKNLERIIAVLGDVSQLIRKYEAELAQSDPNMKQSKIKQQQHSPQGRDYEQTQNSSSFVKNAKRVKSSHPMSLSLAGVKSDAYSGIQKYVKLHQSKILAQERQRYEALKAEQDRKVQKKMYERKMMIQKGFKIKSLSEHELQYIFDFDSKEEYAKAQHLNLAYYTKQSQEDRDANGLENMLRRYEKALRVYFTNYCGKKQGFALKSFDEHSERNSFIHPSSIFRLLVDHGLDGFINAKEIQALARKVNYKLQKIKDDPELMDFQAFREFVVQLAFTMYTRPPKDLRGHPIAQMLEELLSNLQLYAKQNRISPQLFASPQASIYSSETQAIRVLNDQLLENPDYILPQGYKKITETKIIYDYKIYLQAMSLTYKEVYEVLDEMLFEAFKFHIIEPFTKEEKLTTARPNIYHLERHKIAETVELKHIPVSLKKEVAKFPIKDRTTAKEAATALADIIQAIELNHEEIGQKHENPIVRSKRQQEEEERRLREIQDRKRMNFDRQLKTTMGDYAGKKESEKQRKDKEKQEELERLRQQKQRKQRRDRDMKSKVEEYAQRKKEDEQAKKASEQSRLQKQRQQAQRKKRELQQTKRKIEQAKKQKQQEEKQRKEREKQEQKRRLLEQRKKFQKAQREKKQKIQEFKARKKGESKVMDQPEPQPQPQVQQSS